MHCIDMHCSSAVNVVQGHSRPLFHPVKPIHIHRGQLQVVHGVVRSSNRTKWATDGQEDDEHMVEQAAGDGEPSHHVHGEDMVCRGYVVGSCVAHGGACTLHTRTRRLLLQ